jgi:phosphatidylserine decarboxylase
MRPAREGYRFIGAAAGAAALAAVLGWHVLALGAVVLCGFFAWFFRDPERRVPEEEGLVVSPADGRVIEVVPEAHVDDLTGPATRGASSCRRSTCT